MFKDYKRWMTLKITVNNVAGHPFFHEREIWYCYLGENVGFEQDGKGDLFMRPIIVLRKFNQEIFWGLPLTSTLKSSKYYSVVDFGLGKKSSVILSQIRLIDAKRLSHKIGVVSEEEFDNLVIKKFKALLP